MHQLFDHLQIPYHRAPGEAEAECARLQQLGIVDAVWADDGDAFMFGATRVLKQHKKGMKRVEGEVKVYEAESLLEKHDLDAESIVLFAMLSGGDYDVQGLRGCGPETARLVSTRSRGLARAASHVNEAQLPAWRETLKQTLRECGKNVEAPWTFPDFKALGNYRSPAVSTDEQLHNLRGLRKGWDQPIDQTKLRVMLRERFNLQTKDLLKHIAPLYLVRSLARASPEQRVENLKYGVQRKRTKMIKPVEGCEEPAAKSEVKITYSPLPAMDIDLSQPPPNEDWSMWKGEGDSPYHPAQQLEFEILECFLKNGLPEGSYDAPTATKRKRKAVAEVSKSHSDDEAPSSSPAKRAKTTSSNDDGLPVQTEPKKRGRPPKGTTTTDKPRKRTKKSDVAAEERTPSPPPATFRMPRTYSSQETTPSATNSASQRQVPSTSPSKAPPPNTSGSTRGSDPPRPGLKPSRPAVVDLCDGSESESEHDGATNSLTTLSSNVAIHAASVTAGAEPAKRSVPPRRPIVEDSTPGETFGVHALRDLRAGLLSKVAPDIPSTSPNEPALASAVRASRTSEVIDLT